MKDCGFFSNTHIKYSILPFFFHAWLSFFICYFFVFIITETINGFYYLYFLCNFFSCFVFILNINKIFNIVLTFCIYHTDFQLHWILNLFYYQICWPSAWVHIAACKIHLRVYLFEFVSKIYVLKLVMVVEEFLMFHSTIVFV